MTAATRTDDLSAYFELCDREEAALPGSVLPRSVYVEAARVRLEAYWQLVRDGGWTHEDLATAWRAHYGYATSARAR